LLTSRFPLVSKRRLGMSVTCDYVIKCMYVYVGAIYEYPLYIIFFS
jgi:hypothetical protein